MREAQPAGGLHFDIDPAGRAGAYSTCAGCVPATNTDLRASEGKVNGDQKLLITVCELKTGFRRW
jgi:hypothetical protein